MQMTREHASRMHFDFHLFSPKILMISYYDFVDMNTLEIIEIRWKDGFFRKRNVFKKSKLKYMKDLVSFPRLYKDRAKIFFFF